MGSSQLLPAGEVLARQLEDPEVRELWDTHAPARALALLLAQYRAEHDLTQTELARLIGLKQPAVARLETGEHMPTIATLVRIADALAIEFLLDIKPATKRRSWVSSRAEEARVIERVTTQNGSEVLVAAS
jgi:transcriptional regulator with XRE-family HTH domain